jgi:hypothetical protein
MTVLTVMALAPRRTMIIAIAMAVPLTPALSRKRARGTQCHRATFTSKSLAHEMGLPFIEIPDVFDWINQFHRIQRLP